MKFHGFLVLLVLSGSTGCDPALAVNLPKQTVPTEAAYGDRFEPSRSGTISGLVRWNGDRPLVEAVKAIRFAVGSPAAVDHFPHPNAPRIGAAGELQSTLVYLAGIDPRRAKPMTPSSLDVELDAAGLMFGRDGRRERTAWLPAGSTVRLANRIDGIGGIRARGAAFFGHVFPNRDGAAVRTVTEPGQITFTSASGQYWATADLFVTEHPYYAITDESGLFRFEQVPDGVYEIVVWHPNWHVAGHELDPETGVVARQSYAAPVESRTVVHVAAGSVLDVELALQADDFHP